MGLGMTDTVTDLQNIGSTDCYLICINVSRMRISIPYVLKGMSDIIRFRRNLVKKRVRESLNLRLIKVNNLIIFEIFGNIFR